MKDIIDYNGKLYPCMEDNKDHKFYQGKSKNTRCSRCEFEDTLHDFIDHNFKEYVLLECCDIEYRDSSKPEAIFVNRNNSKEKIAIEVKRIFKVFDDNLKKDDKRQKAENSFKKYYLDKIGQQAIWALQEILCIELNQINMNICMLNEFILQHTYITFGYDNINRCSFKELFLKMSSSEQEDSFIQFRIGFKEFYTHLLDLLLSPNSKSEFVCEKEFILEHEIYNKIHKHSLNIHFSKHENGPYIQWFDHNPYSEWRPNTKALMQKMNKYFKSCENKFSSFNCHRILLLKNESNYFSNYLIDNLRKFQKPAFIDEIWCSFYQYDDIYDKEGELIGESIKGIAYEKIS